MTPRSQGALMLSVIVATHRRPQQLARLLHSLAAQLRDSSRELLIAENGTPSPAPLPPDVTIACHIHEPAPGKCRAQNRAIRAARGDVIVCLDDDVTAAADYLDEVEGFFARHPQFAAMKGRILPAEDPVARAGPLAAYLDLPIVDHGERVIEVRGVLGANMAFRAAALGQVGLFDERLGPGACGHEEETEMSARLRRAGLRIGYAPAALVYHEVDAARASRDRCLRIARERGRCRALHERHSMTVGLIDASIAAVRLRLAQIAGARIERIVREEKRLATAQGLLEGLRRGPGLGPA